MANTSNNSYPILSPPTYKQERKHQNFPKVSCGLYALWKILLNAPCLFSAKSSINLSWHKSYKRNWMPVEGTDSAFFGLTIDREGLLNKIYWLFLPTLGVSLGACVIPSCGRPVNTVEGGFSSCICCVSFLCFERLQGWMGLLINSPAPFYFCLVLLLSGSPPKGCLRHDSVPNYQLPIMKSQTPRWPKCPWWIQSPSFNRINVYIDDSNKQVC